MTGSRTADSGDREVYVHRAVLELPEGSDERAVGGAVAVALCGSWDHDPPCRWPNNNGGVLDGREYRFRTVFAASPAEEPEVRERIETGLRDGEWRLVHSEPGDLTAEERTLGERMARS
jgi:hypothetical protein